jgi:hypothetical protein
MDFIVNDRSLHGQFKSQTAFIESFKNILTLRTAIERSRRSVRCSRELINAQISSESTLRDMLRAMDPNLRRVTTTWLANKGPFWDDEPLHGDDDWFEDHKGEIITKTGLGEAAMAILHSSPCATLTFDPSKWLQTPLSVHYVQNDRQRQEIAIPNHWTLSSLEPFLSTLRTPLASWEDLVQWAQDECPRIKLTPDIIRPLDGYPFLPGAAERFQELLKVLDTLQANVGADDHLLDRGIELQQNHFVGEKAWFTDSSDDEKRTFKSELTFPDPERPGKTILCGWHGKVKIGQMRMHFTYPLRYDRPLYVVYLGPKLTKR